MTAGGARPPEVSAEIPATPEQVWELSATGPGISTWFMPATVEPEVGGTVTQRHGPGDGDVSTGRVTAYEPPSRFAYEEQFEGRTIATEFLVEAQSGGTCVLRVVTHGLGADDADFTGDLVSGWTQALATLRVRAAAFAGRPAGLARLWTRFDAPLDEAWEQTTHRLGLDDVTVGQAVDRTDAGHPPFRGTVELVQERAVLVRVDAPNPGVLSLIATDFGDRASVVIDRYVYSDDAQTLADAERSGWETYLTAAASA